MKQYKHLFFDLDHTLWDFEANSKLSLEELYEQMNLKEKGVYEFDLFHRNYLEHNDRLWDYYRKGTIKVDDLRWKRMFLSLLDFKIADETLARKMGNVFLDLLPTRKLLFPYAKEILDYLRETNYHLHLITNGFEKTQHSKLQHSGIAGYFEEVITSEGSNSLKPHKEIFEYALQKTNAEPEECIMIGDSIDVDILGAFNAGIDQVHVNHLNNEVMKVNDTPPTFTVFHLKELQNIF